MGSTTLRADGFGDLNDYRKYGLLRTLARWSGLSIGVCWLLTKDDGKGAHAFWHYLPKPTRWRKYDPELYDSLQRLLQPETRRTVRSAREWQLIPGATYFEALLPDGLRAREAYFELAWTSLHDCQLAFIDPDIGIEIPSVPRGRRGSAQYIYWAEVDRAYRAGHSLLIYQHFPRVVRERFVPFLCEQVQEELGASRVTAFTTPQAAFLLVQQPRHLGPLAGIAEVESRWAGQIEPWPRESREAV